MNLLSKLLSYFPTSSASNDLVSSGESRWWSPISSWKAGNLHAGEDVSEGNLLTSATCFACTKALSETAAGLPAAVYKGLVTKKEIDHDKPAWELLVDQPNPEMDSFTFTELLVTRVVNSGNFFAEIQRDNRDRPVGLWPIHPSRVQPMRESDGSLFWQISSDYTGSADYQDPTWRQENLRFLSPHNMLNVVGFGSTNGIISPGILPGAQEISLDFATRRYGGDFFKGGATPVGFVEHPGFIPDEGKRNLFRNDLNRVHNNREAAHKIGILWENAKYKQIGIAPEQAQFLETRKYTSHQICKMYGVPPAIVGDYEDNKFATADAMIRAFVMLTLRNLVVRIEKAFYRQILNVKSDGRLKKAFSTPLIYKLAIDGLLRGDPKMQAETWRVLREGGVATANDILRDRGMNPIEGPEGDYRIVPGGYVRLDQIDNQGDRQENADKQPAFDREALAEMIAASGLVPAKASVRGSDVLSETLLELAEDAIGRIHNITLSQIQRWREQDPADVTKKLSAFWDKQRDRLIDALGPCDKVAARISEGAVVSQLLADAYVAKYSRLDNHDIFDAAKTQLNFDLNAIIEEELCLCS